MSDFEKEHLKNIQSNCFWAGFLNDLPKDKAWMIADEIVEAIEFALKQANGVDSKLANCAIFGVINWVAVKEQLPPDESKKYLVFRDGEIQFDKWIFDGTKGYWWDYLGITHWCEMPEPPCL